MEMSLWRMMRQAGRFDALRKQGADRLAAFQREQLARLVAHARKHAPFYRELYGPLPEGAVRIEELPPTTKPMVMERFDDVVTDRRLNLPAVRRFAEDIANQGRLHLDEFVVTNTSGTTGLRGYVVQHVREWETFFALNALRPAPVPSGPGGLGRLLRAPFAGIRVAVVAGTGVNFITPMAFLIMPPLLRRFARVELISTLLPVNEMVDRLNRFQPDRIHGYPTMLEALACRQAGGALGVRPTDISTSSEPLTPRAREAIERAFGVFVENTYGSTEGWIMGKECPRGRMHLYADGCIVEAVDAQGRPVPPGRRSEKILLTNLFNFTQPTIRYEMQDRVVPLEGTCACGSPLPMVELVGREDDTFYCRAADGAYLAFPPMSLESLMLELGGYRMFQIRQVERNRIRIVFVPAQGEDPGGVQRRIHEHVSGYFSRHGLGAQVRIDVQAVAEVERMQASQKAKQIASLVGPPADLDARRTVR